LLILRGVAETSIQTSHKIQSIIHEIQDATEKTRTLAPKIYSRELVETIFLQPYTRIGHLVERDVAQRQTASVYLQKLEEIGILQSQKVGRDTLYLNPALLDILRA
jgi:Fic family protein